MLALFRRGEFMLYVLNGFLSDGEYNDLCPSMGISVSKPTISFTQVDPISTRPIQKRVGNDYVASKLL